MENSLNIDFSTYDIGRDYYRNNRTCIWDSIRKILVVKTQEEIVRQKFIKYLITELNVPEDKIEVEVPMTHFKKGAKGRADIVVYGEDRNGCDVPIIIIECKAPSISLIDDVWFQAYKYDEILEANFIIITNSKYTFGAVYDDEDCEYYLIEELPKYRNVLNDENFKYIEDNSIGWRRPKFNRLTSKSVVAEFFDFGWISESTDEKLYPLIVNLGGLLQDTSLNFPKIDVYGLNIVEDGHRYSSFGNAAGGSWEGDYRYFILEDEDGNNQIVSISILGSRKTTNDPVFGNRKGHTTLVVAIDDFEKRHNSLQLNIDKYTKVEGSKYTIWHDGTMTVGKGGAARKSDVISYIKKKQPSMVYSNKLILGTFDCNKEISWNQDNTKDFMRNVIKYALLRDEYRRIKQKN